MSIKRSREYSRRPSRDHDEASATPNRVGRVGRKYSFDRDVASRPPESAVVYAAACRYAENDLLEHALFGRGLVTRVDGGRIEVLFKEGLKKLAHDPSGPAPRKAAADGAEPPLTPAPAASAVEGQAARTGADEGESTTGSDLPDR